MNNYEIKANEKFNSLEISFTGKPDETTRTALKALGFRWNPKKSVWYGFAEVEEVEKALSGVSVEEIKKAVSPRSALASLWDRTKTDSIPEHNRRESTKEVAKQTREHIKSRFPELKFSCRIGKGGWAAYNEVIFEFVSGPYKKDSEAFEAIEEYVKAWLWSFNYDNSDSMTDYFDRNFYEEISSYDYTETEPTEAQKKDLENFAQELEKANKEAEEKAHAEYLAYLEEQEEQRKAYEIRKAQEEKDRAEILAAVQVSDLSEDDKYIIEGVMIEGIGKEASTAEILEDSRQGNNTALIKRELHFSSVDIYNKFCNMLLHDYDFLSGCGGTGTFDERVNDDNFYKLNPEQRESIKWVLWDCVAVYVNNVLMLVIDPEGYSYARYTYIIQDYTKTPLHKVEEEEKQTEREAFYMPEPIAVQAENIHEGEQYTLIYNDPWTMCATMHHITINKATITDYAQYRNSLYIEYIEKGKRKAQGQYFHDGSGLLLYPGHLAAVPESLSRRHINGNMYEVLNAGASVRDFLKNVYKYFEGLSISPLVNTLQF